MSAYTAADLCHCFSRRHICAFFARPALAFGFLLISFATTTESAQFSVGHVKRTIRMLGQTSGVADLQLFVHSRDAAALLSALRKPVKENS